MTLVEDNEDLNQAWPAAAAPAPVETAAIPRSVTDLEDQTRTLIRERPVVAVLAAAGIGYLVARFVARTGR